MEKRILHAIQVMFLDVLILNGAFLFAFMLRFDFRWSMIPEEFIIKWIHYAALNSVVSLIIYYVFRMYNIIWRFIGINESIKACIAITLAALVNAALSVATGNRLPIAVYIVAYGISFIGILGIRVAFRLFTMSVIKNSAVRDGLPEKSVMVIGAGEAGRMLIRDILLSNKLNMDVKCVIDDNKNVCGKYIEDIPIVGDRDHILPCVQKYHIDTILIAIPSAPKNEVRDILDICKLTKCDLKILPGMYQLVSGSLSVNNLRDVNIEDLLGRDPIRVNMEEIMGYVSEKIVMVTGGGGSIGSELCRQIASHSPKQLIIVDIYENNAYDIQQELLRKYTKLNLVVLIASVRDKDKINDIFEKYKPNIVFHAAAHKHVPLMEDVPCEAIKNNVFGTYNTAKAAIENEADKFVLISTDKAVNPTNIMGASKRICEMVVQTLSKKAGRTNLVAVRFGNVLGSNGSVIPLFKKQIEEGGPVTVTHPDIIRYFMTIPEAVSLVLQAGAYAKGGEIFILNMGAPVKIDDLAKNIIRLSGYTPGVDMQIKYTGLRPGEKLYEELLMSEEGKRKTDNDLIYIGKPIEMDEDKFEKNLTDLYEMAYENANDIKDFVAQMVPTYNRVVNN